MKTKSILSMLVLAGGLVLFGCAQGKKGDSNDASTDSTQVEQSAAKKASTADSVEVTAGGDRVRAVKDGEPYTGEIWSEDGKTYVMKFKDGKSYEGILYHKNGKPAMPIEAAANAVMVTGMRFPTPIMSVISFLWVVTNMAPAAMKRVIFMKAWATMWYIAPATAYGESMHMPSTMYESCPTVE